MKFLNEFKDYKSEYYKLVTHKDWISIKKYGLNPKFQRKYNGIKGSWTIPVDNIYEWVEYNKFFGSPIQALLLKPSEKEWKSVIIKIKIDDDRKIYRRNLSEIFNKFNLKNYRSSFTQKERYDVEETLITGFVNIKDIKLVNIFTPPKEISEKICDPRSLIDFILGKGNYIVTGRKIWKKIGFLKILFNKVFNI